MPTVLRGPTNLTLAFSMTLALSAAFAASWGWLSYGGAIERAALAERAAAQNALDVAADALAQELVRAAQADGCALELDANGQIVGPFRISAAATPEPSLAEMTAFARLSDGRADDGQADALAFLQHAATERELTPQGWLILARLQGERDARLGAESLAAAPATVNDAHCGPVPFRLLAALLAATWPGADVDTLTATLLAELRRVPTAGVAVAAEAIVQALPSLNADARLQAIVSAANAFPELRDRPAPSTATPGPGGSAVVPVVATADPDAIARVFVLAAASTLRAADHARRQAAASQPDYDLRLADDIDAIDPAPTRAMPGLGQTWGARARQWPMSHILALAARGALALALLTFVLGNLAVLRLVRREVALARLRRDFVDVVSHELRTPLAALSLKAEMLAAGDVPPPRVAHYVHGLNTDVRRLNEQVQRILDFARLEKGAPLRRDRLPARALVAHGLRAGLPALRLVQQRVVVDVPRSMPTIKGDVEVLGRALRNLLENAAKYAPPGSTVEVSAKVSDTMLVVEVRDRGPGVSAREQRAIFAPFRRGADIAESTPGSGLGLALVDAAARAHRGRVSVCAREGGGSVFTLCLPVATESEAS